MTHADQSTAILALLVFLTLMLFAYYGEKTDAKLRGKKNGPKGSDVLQTVKRRTVQKTGRKKRRRKA